MWAPQKRRSTSGCLQRAPSSARSKQLVDALASNSKLKLLKTATPRPTQKFVMSSLLLFTLILLLHSADCQQQIQHNARLHFSVAENLPNGTYIGSIRASDGQLPAYLLKSATPEDELNAAISYNATRGELYTNATLDREKRDQYDFIALCTQPFLEVHVTVIVKDVNDNAPIFLLPAQTAEFVIDIPENLPRGTRRDLPKAIDLDAPQNAIQEFRLLSGNTPSGAFHLVDYGAPNRSVLHGSNLQDESGAASIAADNPQLMQQLAQQQNVLIPSAPLALSPQMLQTAASTSISSSSSSSSMASPQSNSPTSVAFAGTKANEYKIQLEFNMLLDRENQSSYQLVVEAQDFGRPPLIGKLMVTVNVLDVNDNDPTFSKQLYEVHLREDAFKNTHVLQVQAHDADADKNAELSYFITHHSSPSQQLFTIPDPSKGEIFLVNQLDYETEKEHELMIEARDHGKPARSGYAKVKVIVDDVNDDPPQLNRASNNQDKRLLPNSEHSKFDISSNREAAEVSQNYIQNFNLINWFTQINSSLLFVIVLIALFVVAFPVCLVKIKSRQPESDYTDKDGTMNSVGSHRSTHPSALALPATPNTAPNLHHGHIHGHNHGHNHNHTHHSHSILPLPSSHLQLHHGTSSLQRHQMPSASPCNAPAKLDTWPQRPACSSTMGCLPGVGTPMHGASNSTLDCAYTAPLDQWSDLGVSSQLVNAHDWCGSYNWDYLSDWTPEYRTLFS